MFQYNRNSERKCLQYNYYVNYGLMKYNWTFWILKSVTCFLICDRTCREVIRENLIHVSECLGSRTLFCRFSLKCLYRRQSWEIETIPTCRGRGKFAYYNKDDVFLQGIVRHAYLLPIAKDLDFLSSAFLSWNTIHCMYNYKLAILDVSCEN